MEVWVAVWALLESLWVPTTSSPSFISKFFSFFSFVCSKRKQIFACFLRFFLFIRFFLRSTIRFPYSLFCFSLSILIHTSSACSIVLSFHLWLSSRYGHVCTPFYTFYPSWSVVVPV
ncbi:hypothetical protein CPB83DRAFT_853402 [Crepidotus variabilis]|uniref:Secreted protein n=1 Tax=Crepidotus variabilis TaxID=179855 RepID=A0A9P6JPV0_9AGAR|nr:hypothetical protein CPB83DRAFT_853402 [Crepidotus variabilis]